MRMALFPAALTTPNSGSESSFRRARGRLLAAMIAEISAALGRPLRVLDVGGRADYWNNVGLDGIERIEVLNQDDSELSGHAGSAHDGGRFRHVQGDARDMRQYVDGAFDLVHSNSVIEHVGAWENMQAMARELRRVGRAGWVQTPAWEFPLEPHFRVPFMHWFAAPVRRKMLWFSSSYRNQSADRRRYHVDRINLLSRKEVSLVFPDCEIYVERVVLLPKSYVAKWGHRRDELIQAKAQPLAEAPAR